MIGIYQATTDTNHYIGKNNVESYFTKPERNQMKIKFCDYYETSGCEFYGKLAVVEYWDESKKVSDSLPLEGFGRGTFMTFSQKADELLKSEGIKIKSKLLGIPVAVYEIE